MIYTYEDRLRIGIKIKNIKYIPKNITKKILLLSKIRTILNNNNIPYSYSNWSILFDLMTIKDEIIDNILNIFPKPRRKNKQGIDVIEEKIILSFI